MIVKVLGPGCRNCVNLERATRQAIVGYGVMATPALVVDEKLVCSGRVPTAAEVGRLLTATMTQ